MDCDVCQKEEAKSKTLKLNKTKILQKAIIPSNQCWNCNLTFQDGETQVKHFLDEHECQACGELFDNVALKEEHFSEEHAICDVCGEIFENDYKKDYHILKKHEADNKANAAEATTDEQTYFQSTSDQKRGKPQAGRKHRKVCSIQ